MYYYIIDRIEGQTAVLEGEDLNSRNIPRSKLPQGVHEGDMIFEEDSTWYKDERAAAARRAEIQKKAEKLYLK